MLVGDNAQLPPVKQDFSHGLDADYLSRQFSLSITETELTEVTRQSLESGILYNATLLRDQLTEQKFKIQFQTKRFPDFYRMTGEKLEEGLRYAYHKYGTENTTIICRSNKMAVRYNQHIRRSILFYENEIEAGDYLMIVRNNYFFLSEDSPAGFLANGDFVEVKKMKNFEEVHGFRFATLVLRLVDYPEQDEFEAKVVLNTLYSPAPALTEDESNSLFESVMEEYKDVVTKKERNEAIRSDLYLNALQVKFAYALTCHKSQGGQWEAVFVDQGFLKPEMLNREFIRWTYTAIPRAKSELFLMNFHEMFF
jgi:exodeoxyribonuclease-5